MLLSFDTETFLIGNGRQAPPMVCASFATDAANPSLLLRDDALTFLCSALKDNGTHFVGQNIAYDFAVVAAERPALLPLIFAAYDAGRVHDIRVRDMMLLNARGELQEEAGRIEFTLEGIVRRRFGVDLSADKKASADQPVPWRLRYAELDGVPLDQWPEEAVRYVLDDARWPLRVYEDQEAERDRLAAELGANPLVDEPGQTRAAFALHLMACWGILTDEEAVLALEARLLETVGAAREKLIASGILKGKGKKGKDGVIGVEWAKDTKKIKDLVERGFAAKGLAVPRTDPSDTFPEGQTKTDEETLREAGDADLLVLADVMGDEKLLTTYVQALKGRIKRGNTKEYDQRGLYLPGRGWLIQSSPNVLVASGRTSWSKPNLQNPPRKGGVRECFVPRDGYWFLSVDYSFIEMVCWAQVCLDMLGRSALAEAIRENKDPHCLLAVDLVHAFEGRVVTYEEVVAAKKTWARTPRQQAKVGNFGFMGGLGAPKFVEYAKGQGVELTEQEAVTVKQAWRQRWPENFDFFAQISAMQPFGSDSFTYVAPRTGFVRGGCDFKSGANTTFQGLAARGAKEAMWLVAKACYGDAGPLAGSRQVAFLHDELFLEVPAHRERAHEAAQEVSRLMVEAMTRFVPDVPVKAEAALCARWYKEAEPVYGKDGVLELWTPKEVK